MMNGNAEHKDGESAKEEDGSVTTEKVIGELKDQSEQNDSEASPDTEDPHVESVISEVQHVSSGEAKGENNDAPEVEEKKETQIPEVQSLGGTDTKSKTEEDGTVNEVDLGPKSVKEEVVDTIKDDGVTASTIPETEGVAIEVDNTDERVKKENEVDAVENKSSIPDPSASSNATKKDSNEEGLQPSLDSKESSTKGRGKTAKPKGTRKRKAASQNVDFPNEDSMEHLSREEKKLMYYIKSIEERERKEKLKKERTSHHGGEHREPKPKRPRTTKPRGRPAGRKPKMAATVQKVAPMEKPEVPKTPITTPLSAKSLGKKAWLKTFERQQSEDNLTSPVSPAMPLKKKVLGSFESFSQLQSMVTGSPASSTARIQDSTDGGVWPQPLTTGIYSPKKSPYRVNVSVPQPSAEMQTCVGTPDYLVRASIPQNQLRSPKVLELGTVPKKALLLAERVKPDSGISSTTLKEEKFSHLSPQEKLPVSMPKIEKPQSSTPVIPDHRSDEINKKEELLRQCQRSGYQDPVFELVSCGMNYKCKVTVSVGDDQVISIPGGTEFSSALDAENHVASCAFAAMMDREEGFKRSLSHGDTTTPKRGHHGSTDASPRNRCSSSVDRSERRSDGYGHSRSRDGSDSRGRSRSRSRGRSRSRSRGRSRSRSRGYSRSRSRGYSRSRSRGRSRSRSRGRSRSRSRSMSPSPRRGSGPPGYRRGPPDYHRPQGRWSPPPPPYRRSRQVSPRGPPRPMFPPGSRPPPPSAPPGMYGREMMYHRGRGSMQPFWRAPYPPPARRRSPDRPRDEYRRY